ncbi:MAG: hypothetical protein HY645_02320 [Acidobacteria bacterium]|nr:hypothetical protein [Acidobacteriota bacterium]
MKTRACLFVLVLLAGLPAVDPGLGRDPIDLSQQQLKLSRGPEKFSTLEQARLELQRKVQEEEKNHQLRDKVELLIQTSSKLHQRLNNPFILEADTPKLARECERLIEDIKKLMP